MKKREGGHCPTTTTTTKTTTNLMNVNVQPLVISSLFLLLFVILFATIPRIITATHEPNDEIILTDNNNNNNTTQTDITTQLIEYTLDVNISTVIPTFSFANYSMNDTHWRENSTLPDGRSGSGSGSGNGIVEPLASTSCYCGYCSCNGNTCPLPVYYFTQLVGTNCPSNKIPTIGYLSIDSTSTSDGFKYYIVDEANRHLAIGRQPFSYLTITKSMPSSSGVTCAHDSSQTMRIPIQGIYVVAESTNWIFNTNLRYYIDVGCAVPPYSVINTQFVYSGQRVYQHTEVKVSVKFFTVYNDIDNWQQGTVTNLENAFSFNVANGEGYQTFFPSTLGSATYNLRYNPNNVFGAYAQNFGPYTPFTVYKIATRAQLFPKGSSTLQVNLPLTTNFQVDYEIFDNDNTITPEIQPNKIYVLFYNNNMQLISSNDMSCATPSSTYGIGTLNCQLSGSAVFAGRVNMMVYYLGRSEQIGSTPLDIVVKCNGTLSNNPAVCNGNGVCSQFDVCVCSSNYGGRFCEIPKCAGMLSTNPQVCSGHGTCIGQSVGCVCHENWGGLNCEIPKCNGTLSSDPTVCNSRGSCHGVDLCQCMTSWVGQFCDIPICNGTLATDPSVCNARGSCENVDTCQCIPSWTGPFCEIPKCNGTLATDPSVCNGKGACTSAEQCECVNYGGQYCDIQMCGGILATDPHVCTGRGQCLDVNTCQCDPGYIGDNCQKLECTFNQENVDGNVVSIHAPTPTIISTSTLDGIYFSVSFSHDQTVPYQHLMFIGNSHFSLSNCSVSGDHPLTLTSIPKTRTMCLAHYNTTYLKLSEIIAHPLVTKQHMLDEEQNEILKLTMPLTLQYFDATGQAKDGICSSFEFKTTETIYVKTTSLIDNQFLEYSPLHPYSAVLYASQTTTIEGVLNVNFILVTTNLTLNSFTFYNTSSAPYTLQVTDTSLWMQSGQKNYYFIQTNSGKALSDFRATIFFKSNLKRLGVLDVIDIYFPVVIDFTIITPPPNQNFTLQAEMTLASDSTSWNPKSTFIGNDRVFVKVSSTSYALLENNHLTVKDAYLCCFKQFVASLPKDTGCLQYNSDTMDVWKKIISSSTTVNAELSTKIHPFSNTNYAFGFSFQISSSLFPEKLSQTASSCFVQAKVGTATPLSKRNRLEEPSTLQASLFLVDLSQKRSASSLASSLRRNVVLWNLMSACVVFAALLFSS